MFNFLKAKKTKPLNDELRRYFEDNLLWLIQEFPEPLFEQRKLLLPTPEYFPIKFNGSHENAHAVLGIVCENMQINPEEIELLFFSHPSQEINYGAGLMFVKDEDDSRPAGFYESKNENGKYEIALDEALLTNPQSLIGTIAHELAHVKLLGEKELEENDEYLTDFACVFFGLGIFSANSAFQFYQESDRWGYQKLGYMSVEEWAYALALFAFARGEDETPWTQYLSKTLQKDFKRCFDYMLEHKSEIFKRDDEQGE